MGRNQYCKSVFSFGTGSTWLWCRCEQTAEPPCSSPTDPVLSYLRGTTSTPVAVTLEVEIEMENTTLKCTLEPLLVRVFPFLVHNTESLQRITKWTSCSMIKPRKIKLNKSRHKAYNILVWRAGMKSYEASVTSASIFLYTVCWCLWFIHKIRVKYIELVTLNNFRRWVVVVIMSLVVFVPFISSMHPIEVLGLSWSILVMPPVHLRKNEQAYAISNQLSKMLACGRLMHQKLLNHAPSV